MVAVTSFVLFCVIYSPKRGLLTKKTCPLDSLNSLSAPSPIDSDQKVVRRGKYAGGASPHHPTQRGAIDVDGNIYCLFRWLFRHNARNKWLLCFSSVVFSPTVCTKTMKKPSARLIR